MPTLLTSPASVQINPKPGGGPPPISMPAWCEAQVVKSNRDDTYKVVLATGNGTPVTVRRLHSTLSDVEILPEGTRVMVHMTLPNGPHIVGIIKWFSEDNRSPLVSTDYALAESVLPGDRRISTDSGNTIAVLAGGVNVLKSAENCKIVMQPDGHIDVLSGTYRQQSAFGLIESSIDDGAVNYRVRAGSNIRAHTGIGRVNAWTLRVDAGSDGDMLKVRVTNPEDEDLGRFHMRSDGRIDLFAAGGRTEYVKGGDTRIVTGSMRTRVEGDTVQETTGNNLVVSGRTETQIRGAEDAQVGGSQLLTVGDSRRVLVGKDEIKNVRGASYHEIYDEYQRVVASTFGGGIPKGQAMSWINYGGGFNFLIQPTAAGSSFNVISALPASVNLGVDGAAVPDPLTGRHTVTAIPGPFGAVLYEPLATFLGNMLNWMDTHVHATTPPGPPTPPVVPGSVVLLPLMPTFRSLRVAMGA